MSPYFLLRRIVWNSNTYKWMKMNRMNGVMVDEKLPILMGYSAYIHCCLRIWFPYFCVYVLVFIVCGYHRFIFSTNMRAVFFCLVCKSIFYDAIDSKTFSESFNCDWDRNERYRLRISFGAIRRISFLIWNEMSTFLSQLPDGMLFRRTCNFQWFSNKCLFISTLNR